VPVTVTVNLALRPLEGEGSPLFFLLQDEKPAKRTAQIKAVVKFLKLDFFIFI
jgi:hypothetical protein